jgi:K+ transporter
MARKKKPPSDKPLRKTTRENTQAREKFGRVAIRLGFVNEAQVKEALDIQRKMDDSGQPHKLIGLIMLEQGMLSNAQLIEMLKYFELQREKEKM